VKGVPAAKQETKTNRSQDKDRKPASCRLQPHDKVHMCHPSRFWTLKAGVAEKIVLCFVWKSEISSFGTG
jgi:hypothetical protein